MNVCYLVALHLYHHRSFPSPLFSFFFMHHLPLSLLLLVFSVNAIIVPFKVRFSNGAPHTSLNRRTPTLISNIGNAQYVSNITLGGVTVPVLLDTGRYEQKYLRARWISNLLNLIRSSDLWSAFPEDQPSITDLDESVSLSYAVGKVTG